MVVPCRHSVDNCWWCQLWISRDFGRLSHRWHRSTVDVEEACTTESPPLPRPFEAAQTSTRVSQV
jgi:hypothetical protein